MHMTTATRYTLHALPDGAYAIVARDITGTAITGQAGFTQRDYEDAQQDDYFDLSGWEFLAITPEAAAYVAATFPVVLDQQ
jgi:hypothetical protein